MTLCMLLSACKGTSSKPSGTGDVISDVPDISANANTTFSSNKTINTKNLMTTEGYHKELNTLLSGNKFGNDDNVYMKKLDDLTDRLEAQIRGDTEDIKQSTETIYYLSPKGDDKNDGKTPKTAWKTLQKAREYTYKPGDVLLLERGGIYRGYMSARNNFKIGAYGKGPKPVILCANDGKTFGKWVETSTKKCMEAE